MSTCHLLDFLVVLTSDDIGSCRIKRRNRPCLVCESYMDLVEVTQSIEIFFIPIRYNAKTMNFLDCPECGFSTSADSYEYIRLCNTDDCGEIEPLSTDIDGEKSLSCGKCKSKLAVHYQFCPTCGTRCNHRLPETKKKAIKFKDDVGLQLNEDFWDKCDTSAVCGCGQYDELDTPPDVLSVSLFDDDWDIVAVTNDQKPATGALV